MKVISKIVALVFALLFAFPALAADEVDVSKLLDSTLSGDQIAEVLSGRTLKGVTSKGSEAMYTFTKEGYLYANFVGASRPNSGNWKVVDGGICLTFQRGGDACPTVVKVVSGKLCLGEWFTQK